MRTHQSRRGFTLIELMVTVAIVAILAAIALPGYRNYVIRGKLVDGTNGLAAMRARMEQYYQDNRTYQNVSSSITAPCSSSTTAGTFTVACATADVTATTYKVTATGTSTTSGFVYTIDQNGNQYTTGLPSSWGGVPLGGYACWITRQGDTC